MKYCPRCKEDKPESEFSKNKSRGDGLQSTCKVCLRKHNKKWYANNKRKHRKKSDVYRNKTRDYFRDLKSKTPCTDCGVSYPYYVMDYDHLDSTTKVANISTMCASGLSIESVKEEADKCELVCSNCHKARTHNRGYVGRSV